MSVACMVKLSIKVMFSVEIENRLNLCFKCGIAAYSVLDSWGLTSLTLIREYSMWPMVVF